MDFVQATAVAMMGVLVLGFLFGFICGWDAHKAKIEDQEKAKELKTIKP